MQELVNRAKELLESGEVARVLGWKKGDLPYNPEPAYFNTVEELKDFVYNGFCGANLSKYLIEYILYLDILIILLLYLSRKLHPFVREVL